MSYGDIGNLNVWTQFFKDIPSEAYSIILHRVDGVKSSGLANTIVIPTIPSRWATWSLVQIEQALFATGLADSENQTFILLSGDTVPILPFAAVYAKLSGKEGFIDYEFTGSNSRERGLRKDLLLDISGSLYKWVKHSQWLVLDRKFVDLLRKHDTLMNYAFSRMVCPDEHAYGIILQTYGILSCVEKAPVIAVDWEIPTSRCVHKINHHINPRTFHVHELTPDLVNRYRLAGNCFLRKICGGDVISPDIIYW